MYHSIDFDEANEWVRCYIRGDIDITAVETVTGNIIRAFERHPECRHFICDASDTSLDLSIIQIWQAPRLINEIVQRSADYESGAFSIVKRAFIVSEQLKQWHFFEVVATNIGQSVKVFTDEARAASWLREEMTPVSAMAQRIRIS